MGDLRAFTSSAGMKTQESVKYPDSHEGYFVEKPKVFGGLRVL
jgi:hypothetical protein